MGRITNQHLDMLFREDGLEDDFEVRDEIDRLTSTDDDDNNTDASKEGSHVYTDISKLQNAENVTFTENGDVAYISTGNKLIDILFQSNWLRTHPEQAIIGASDKERLFSMFMRDPRYGIGEKNLGRHLLQISGVSMEDVYKCGRADDIWRMFYKTSREREAFDFLYNHIKANDQLTKKWMPRFATHNMRLNQETQSHERCAFTSQQLLKTMVARRFADTYGMNKQQYKKFIKADTTERTLTEKRFDDINFEHLPALCHMKYTKMFMTRPELSERYKKYIEDVKVGVKKINTSVTTVYDVYKNAVNNKEFDGDMWYDQLEKISISCVPVIDVSGSMWTNDAIGKAISLGYYLSDCSTYCKNQFVTFSRAPKLVTMEGDNFLDKLENMKRADWGMNTDLGAVADLLLKLEGNMPDWIIIMSDMQFDRGSTCKITNLIDSWRARGIQTKIVWWNLSTIKATTPQMVAGGSIFMSGLSPMLLKYLSVGFNAEIFLDTLLEEYKKNISIESTAAEVALGEELQS